MPSKVELTLPVPPSVNRIWRRSKHGGMYKIDDADNYTLRVVKAWRDAKLPPIPFPKGVAVKYTVTWYRFPKSGDLSNRLKVVEDALNGVAWADDKQVEEIHALRIDCPRGKQRITITIEAA